MRPAQPPIICPYRHEYIATVKPWVPWIKRAIVSFRLNRLAERLRGKGALTAHTGGWNVADPALTWIGQEKRLNLGCGQANYHGYINVDIARWGHLHAQVGGQFLPFKSNVFDEVLCTDVIEHLTEIDGMLLFKEVYRTLKPGGRFLMITPDLDNIMLMYQTRTAPYARILQHLLGDDRDHKFLYTIPIASQKLETIGFNIVRIIPLWGPIWAHLAVLAEKL